MPEKIVETNGVARPVAEKTPAKVEETARRYMREAGINLDDASRTYNELIATTTRYYFDTLDRTVRGTMEIATRAEHSMEDMMTLYRRIYTEGFKSWQTYIDDVNKMIVRPK